MKASLLISILANHLVEHGDHEVFCHPGDFKTYSHVTHCWYNHGKDNDQPDRIVIGLGEEK